MPTKEEISELLDNCTWVWESVNGVDGYTVTGPSGNSIFFPAVGAMNGKTIGGRGSSTAVWSSSVDSSAPSNAWALSLVKISGQSSGRYSRCGGFPIRPVCTK